MASQTIAGPELQFTPDNKRCYAYTGGIGAHTTTQTVMDFTTADYTVDAIFYFNGPTQLSNPGGGIDSAVASIKFDGVIIAQLKVQTQNTYFLGQTHARIIIPPHTAVIVQFDASDTDANKVSTGLLTGDVYDHLPVRN